ncbi:MAG TPA: hypothetical protein VHU87_11370, partial [Rhizomicrobium sp.]|nr:hypothetical protein [Rhizomicrobium sp.]
MRLLPILFCALALSCASAALAQDDDEAPPPRAPVSDDAKFVAYAQPTIVFTHAEIVDGTGGRARYDQTVLVQSGRIAAMGAHVAIPAGAAVIDA